MLAFAVPAAEAKQAKLDGQLIAGATTAGSKVEAPILLTEESAKKLKLRSPLATLTTKASATLPAPNPLGEGVVQIAAGTLRAGDELAGKAKLKGNRKALMPKLKGKKLEVTSRESRFSVEELTDALVALYSQVGALGLRVDALESDLAQLRTDLEAMKAQNASLQGQINSLITQITDLDAALDALTSVVGGLPTAAQLQAVIDSVTALQGELDALDAVVGTLPTDTDITNLQNQINTINGTLTTLSGTVTGLQTDVTALCSFVPVGVC
ncbi:MAG TPA: hypothetical protein VFY99_06820 [Solirubrobacterales bacterium]